MRVLWVLFQWIIKHVKQDHKLLMSIVIMLYFMLLVLKQIDVVGNCNNINDPYARIYVPDIIINLNVKVFNLMLRTRHRMAWNM